MRMLVTPELMAQVFQLPRDAQIIGSRDNSTYIEVLISSDAFNEFPVDETCVAALYERHGDGMRFVRWKSINSDYDD